MPFVEESTLLSADIHTVFAYITQAENLPAWDSATVEAVQIDPGPPGLGVRTRGQSKIIGRRIEWVTEVTAFEPDRLAQWTAVEGPLGFVATSTVEAAGQGTRYTYRVEAEPGLAGVFGRLTDPLVVAALSRTVKSNLKSLQHLLTRDAARIPDDPSTRSA